MVKSKESKVGLGLICQAALFPMILVSIYYIIKIGINMEKGMFPPKFASTGLAIFTFVAAVLLCIWLFINKDHKFLQVSAIVAVAGILLSAAFIQIAYFFPEKFNVYRGERFFNSISLEELESITLEKKPTRIYYIGSDNIPECTDFYRILSTFAGKYRVVVQYYNTTKDSETRPEKMEEVLKDIGINSIPSVIVVTYGTVSNIFEGETIEHQVRQYFEKEWNNEII